MTLDDSMQTVMPTLRNLTTKFKAFGACVYECNGNDIKEVVEVIGKSLAQKNGPKVIVAHTVKGRGLSFIEGNPKCHSFVLTEEQKKQAAEELGGKSNG